MNFILAHILILALYDTNNKKSKRDDGLIFLLHFLLCIILIILLLAFPGLAHEGTDQGVTLFIEALFPYLLPYLILTQWLLRLTSSANRPLSITKLYTQTYIISALGGFPTGAATIAFLKNNKQLHAREASILLAICHAPSPLFVIGFVSNDLLHNVYFGWQLLILFHSLNIVALFIYIKRKLHTTTYIQLPQKQRTISPFSESMKESAPILLLVGITIVFFTTIHKILHTLLMMIFPELPKWTQLLFTTSLEMTNGLTMATTNFNHHTILPILLATILAIQSLSIHLQIIVLARTADISVKPYITFRLISVVVIPLLYWIIFL